MSESRGECPPTCDWDQRDPELEGFVTAEKYAQKHGRVVSAVVYSVKIGALTGKRVGGVWHIQDHQDAGESSTADNDDSQASADMDVPGGPQPLSEDQRPTTISQPALRTEIADSDAVETDRPAGFTNRISSAQKTVLLVGGFILLMNFLVVPYKARDGRHEGYHPVMAKVTYEENRRGRTRHHSALVDTDMVLGQALGIMLLTAVAFAFVPGRAASVRDTSTTSPDSRNPYAIAGLCLGVISIFLFQFGVFPIAAAILSGMGLAEQKHYRSGRGQAIAGLVLGFIYMLMFIRGVAR